MEWDRADQDADESDWAARYDADALSPGLLDGSIERGKNGDGVSQVSASVAQRESEERALLGDLCPICLHELVDPVMIQGCHHVYCFTCLSSWARNLSLHGIRTPTCPLCKRAFHSAYADVVSESDYEILRFDGSASRRKHTPKDGLLRRTMVYGKHMQLRRVNGIAVDCSEPPRPVKTSKHEFGKWLERELRACVGPHVDLTVLIALIESEIGAPVKRPVDWSALQLTLEPFLQADAAIFVREFAFFLGSTLNMQAYDDAVEYCCSESAASPCSIESCCASHTNAL